MRAVLVTALLLLAASLEACHEESRRNRELAAASERSIGLPVDTIQPGPNVAGMSGASVRITATALDSPYEDNAWALAEGKRLFNWMNCNGCHFSGGGGIAPPLMDRYWVYGSDPRSIFVSIIDGRPNGMPAYRDRINEADAWKLVAYVRSIAGKANHAAAPGRNDSLYVKKPESLKDEEP
jgi:cytochrome c oxidase cbb3-type subunit III